MCPYRVRGSLGGHWNQSGILAAAGIYAIENMPKTLQVDHDNAKLFCKKLTELSHLGIEVDQDVQTNLVVFRIKEGRIRPKEFVEKCKKVKELYGLANVRLALLEHGIIRAAIYRDISREGVELAILTMRTVLEKAQ